MSTQNANSLADFYADPASPFVAFPHEVRCVGSMPVTLMRSQQDSYCGHFSTEANLMLSLGIQGVSQFWWDVGDGPTPVCDAPPGSMLLQPAQTVSVSEAKGYHELLHLFLPASAVFDLLDTHRVGTLASFDTLTGATLFRDDALRRTALQIWNNSTRFGGASDLLIDGLTQVLISGLLDKAGQLRRPQRILPLDQAHITRIERFVEEQMAERITVEALASVLDMPRWTFADAFKATTGETPHAYVTTKRLNRACDLLRLGDMPLAEIAYATGFASQSHMTDTFRRVLGTTPGKWRAEVRA